MLAKRIVYFAIIIFVCAVLASLGYRVVQISATRAEAATISSSFVDQVNSLGRSLAPGESGTVIVQTKTFDQIILLPYGCTPAELSAQLPELAPREIEILDKASKDDHLCPVLVFREGGRCVAFRHARFTVGLDLRLTSWRIRRKCEIRVTKEVTSPNSFLSLVFEDG